MNCASTLIQVISVRIILILISIVQVTKIQNIKQEMSLIHMACYTCITGKPSKRLFTHFRVNLHGKIFEDIIHVTPVYKLSYLLYSSAQVCTDCSLHDTNHQYGPFCQ